MLPKHWALKQKNSSHVVQTLLENRGITDAETFFNPPDPLGITLKDVGISAKEVKKTIARIQIAKEKNERVVIFGDYDVDGVCSTSLLWQALKKAGIDVFPFTPDRFSDGYGMSISGLDKICEAHPEVKLIITVDNGIVANPAIEHATHCGIDVIVTDHHEKHGTNKALSVVHTTEVCGTAVAWFLSRELLGEGARDWLLQSLDLVGIATVADQMKLVGINRSLAYHGIRAIRTSKRVGLLALAEVCAADLTKVGAYEIGFVLGPRMNAAGRLSQALDVVRLLCTSNVSKAQSIAAHLNSLNTTRQDVTREVLITARAEIVEGERFIIVTGAFHEGVIGLAAGKIVEETGRPALVLSRGDTHIKGSARSVSGFHITDALRNFSDLLINVGGHEMAAGLTVSPENVDQFILKLKEYAQDNLPSELLTKKLTIDCGLSFNQISLDLVQEIQKMEPFGMGNPRPVFMTEDVEIVNIKRMGKMQEHLKIAFSSNDVKFEALCFHASAEALSLSVGEKLAIVYNIDINIWNGRQSLELMLKDFAQHTTHGKRETRTRKRISASS